MAGIRQVQLTELDLGLGVVLPPGTLVCKPSSIHMAENCSRPVWFFFFCTGVPWPSGRPAQISAC